MFGLPPEALFDCMASCAALDAVRRCIIVFTIILFLFASGCNCKYIYWFLVLAQDIPLWYALSLFLDV